jgi:hypothetical protein
MSQMTGTLQSPPIADRMTRIRRHSLFIAVVLLACSVVTQGRGEAPVLAAPMNGFTPIASARLMDTRPGFATVDGADAGGGIRSMGSVTRLQIVGRAGIPVKATSVALNITVPEPEQAGFVTVFPCGDVPPTSAVNHLIGETVATAAIGKLDANGGVCLYTLASVHLVVDVTGWLTSSTVVTTTPSRLLDTRPGYTTSDDLFAGEGLRTTGSTTQVRIGGRGTVPADAKAVAVTVTATEASHGGFVTAFGCGGRPLASTLNFLRGQTISNFALVPLDDDGNLCLFTMAPTHLIVDVTAFVPSASDYTPFAPARLVDTRFDGTSIDDRCASIGRPRGGSTVTVPVAGRAGVPAGGVGAVALNVTASGAGAGGYVSIVQVPGAPAATSAVNFAAGATTANSAIVPVDSAGNVTLFVNTGVHVVIDVVGWLPGTSAGPAGNDCVGKFVNPSSRLSTLTTAGSLSGEQCAITTDGSVQCLGFLPNSLVTSFSPPHPVDIADAVQIAGGAGGVCARRSDGTVRCIGGSSGYDTSVPGVPAVEVALSAPAVDISGSAQLACAITTTPTLECWTGDSPPQIVTGVAPPVEFFGAMSYDRSSAGPRDVGTPLNRLALRTADGNAATVTFSTANGATEFHVSSSSDARPGIPWTSVLAAQPSPAKPADMCIILLDRRSACGTTEPLRPGGDLVQRSGTASLEASGYMFDTEPVTQGGKSVLLTARMPDLLGFVTTRNLGSCGLKATGDMMCWTATGIPPYGEVTDVILPNVALP